MSSDIATAIGGIAAVASTTSFLPQALKIVRSRDASGVSTRMYAITVTGFALWTTYGVLLRAWPLIASNGLSLVLSAFILAMKLMPPDEKEKVAAALAPVVGGGEAARKLPLDQEKR